MFRKLLRHKQQLPDSECIEILKNEPRGVLSVVGDEGYPYGLPIDHWYCEENGRLYFHCGKIGHKLDAIRACNKVSYCVMDGGTPEEGGWALYFRSVIVFGRAKIIEAKPGSSKSLVSSATNSLTIPPTLKTKSAASPQAPSALS